MLSPAGRRAPPRRYLPLRPQRHYRSLDRHDIASLHRPRDNRLPGRLQHHREGRDGARRHHHCLSAAGDIHIHRSVNLDGIVTEAPQGIANFPRYVNEIGIATILGAIAFAGGANNLCQSNYIRDKGMGMGVHIPRIVSPITGEEEARPATGYSFEVNEENMRRWNGWWKVANRAQLLTFVIIGLLTLIGLSVLVASVLGEGTYGDPGSIEFLKEEAKVLGEDIGLWFEYFFYIAGFAILFSTNIGIVDYVSRLTADSLKTGYLARSEFWSESKLYFVAAWIICIGGSIIIWSGIQPLWLLVIASSGGGVVMFLYSGMLIWLNRRILPEPIKIKGARLVVVAITFASFAVLSVYLVYWYVNAALTGQL